MVTRNDRDNAANNFHSNTSQKQKAIFERLRINKEAKPGSTNVGFAMHFNRNTATDIVLYLSTVLH